MRKTSTPSESLHRSEVPNLRLIGLLTETPRRLDFRVWHDPENDVWAHCSVEGENTKEKCSDLALGSWSIDVEKRES